jgi:GrpB-like predicted nucleotidyltransferase (UPF0157 family)
VTVSAPRPLEVVPYDPSWPALFERIAEPVRRALAGLDAAVEHVGSTAVPGLAAKPVIDVDVVVGAPDAVPAATDRLHGLGYVAEGDKGIAGRAAFRRPPDAVPHHLYVVVASGAPHRDHVEFRDWLRGHAEDAAAYAVLKRSLAATYRDDRPGYGVAKGAFVAGVLRRARSAS